MTDLPPATAPTPLNQPSFTVRYDQTTAAHTTQFVLCADDEQLLLECSSGLIRSGDDTPALPIHSRLAMPWTAAKRLHELLGQVLQRQAVRKSDGIQGPRVNAPGAAAARGAAALPRFEDANA